MSDAPVKEGDVLAGKYRIDQILGIGGMGVVVAATDIQLERRVAIKFILKDFSGHPEAYTRFLREARAAVKIHSEHVARVFDVGTLETGAPYMVLEYLEGADLSDHAERGDLAPHIAVSYLLQACEAIAEAHAAGIVHRDLKPANLFLARRPDGSAAVKVHDFGISKTTLPGGTDQAALTQTASLMGSPLYMSPEQMQSSRDVDARSDIWALGAILYELLAGTPPFMADSVPQLCVKILGHAARPLTELRPDVPEGLDAVIQRCLEKSADARFPTISELAVALVDFAPAGSRVHVERITRVMRAAGLSDSSLSTREPGVTAPWSGAMLPAARQSGAHASAQTSASWSSSETVPGTSRRTGLWAAVGGLMVLGAGLGAFAVLRATPNNSPDSASGAGSALAESAPSATATVSAPPAEEVVSGESALQDAGSSEQKGAAIGQSDAAIATAATKPTATQTPVRRVTPPPRTKQAPPAEPAATATAAGGRAGFGSRK